VLIAPASANCLSKLAQGRADDLLTTLCLATRAPLALAPAMNHVMWSDPATQANCATLTQRGAQLFGPASGAQACGESGVGRMLEVPGLLQHLAGLFDTGALQGLRVLITAGPTYEPVDPVRFIGNRSSGRMGYALARAAVEAGAHVTLVSGPTHLQTPADVKRIDADTAARMYDAVMAAVDGCDIFIAAAAVADYRPKQAQPQKLKKHAAELSIELERTEDILAAVTARSPRPFVVGFAAETENLEANASAKLQHKKADMIAANRVGTGDEPEVNGAATRDIGFNSEYNALHVIWNGGAQRLEQARKSVIAARLITLIANRYNDRTSHDPDAKNSAQDSR